MTGRAPREAALKGGGRLASTLVLAGLGLAGLAESADLADIKTRGALRVIIAADESPDTFALTGGVRPGFERDLMERFAQLHALRLEVVRAPGYAERIPMLLRGEGDVIAAIFDTPDRREKVAFTAEVIPTHNVAVTLPPQAAITRVEDLRAAKIGVIRGAKPGEAAAEAGVKPRDLVGYEKMDDLLRGLKTEGGGSGGAPHIGAGPGLQARARPEGGHDRRVHRARWPGPSARKTRRCAPPWTTTWPTSGAAHPGAASSSSTSATRPSPSSGRTR